MPWDAPLAPLSGTVITVPWAVSNVINQLTWLRQMTGNADPGAAYRTLFSLSGSVVVWGALPLAAINEPVVRATDPIAASFAAAISHNSGFLEVSAPADGPTAASHFYLLQFRHYNYGAPDHRWQIAAPLGDPTEMYVRGVVGGSAGAWHRLWHSGNGGPGGVVNASSLHGFVPGNAANQIPISNNVENAALNAQYLNGLTAANILSAVVSVPSGLVASFRTAAELAAAGARWTRETALDGRILIGSGTAGGQTFTDTTAYGTTWLVVSGAGTPAGGAVQSGGASSADPTGHLHIVDIRPPSRAYVYARFT